MQAATDEDLRRVYFEFEAKKAQEALDRCAIATLAIYVDVMIDLGQRAMRVLPYAGVRR